MPKRDDGRRLTAILVADVVGYGRPMGADEAGTLAALKADRREIFAPRARQYRGRIVKLVDDGLLMEFASVVDAVRFAVEAQCAVADRNAGAPRGARLAYRIGINIGDVIPDGDDIYGEGVNIAARLEALAPPGGICVARNVLSQVRGKLTLTYEDLGPQRVQNIAEPVAAHRIAIDARARALATPARAPLAQPRRLGWAAALAALALSVAAAWFWPRPAGPPAEAAQPSVAVLAFDNLSGDPAQAYYADGIADDLITGLSKVPVLIVAPRKASFRFRDAAADLRAIAGELGVRYLVEGSVRRAGEEIRINAKLIDAATGAAVWAESYDGRLGDVFALQDRVTAKILAALSVNLGAEELARLADHGTKSVDAHDAFLRGQAAAAAYTAGGAEDAIRHYERALEIDPGYARAEEALEQIRFIERNSGLK